MPTLKRQRYLLVTVTNIQLTSLIITPQWVERVNLAATKVSSSCGNANTQTLVKCANCGTTFSRHDRYRKCRAQFFMGLLAVSFEVPTGWISGGPSQT